jgi:hypothetical protein
MQIKVTYITHMKNIGLWPVSLSHVKCGVSNFVFHILTLQYQDCCIGACGPLYFRFPEDGASASKHVGINLYHM